MQETVTRDNYNNKRQLQLQETITIASDNNLNLYDKGIKSFPRGKL